MTMQKLNRLFEYSCNVDLQRNFTDKNHYFLNVFEFNVYKCMFELDERAFNKYHSPLKFIS